MTGNQIKYLNRLLTKQNSKGDSLYLILIVTYSRLIPIKTLDENGIGYDIFDNGINLNKIEEDRIKIYRKGTLYEQILSVM